MLVQTWVGGACGTSSSSLSSYSCAPPDPCRRLVVPVPHLESEAAPSLRKRDDLALIVPVVAHRLSP
jgi:hypothetical protein